MPKYSLTRHVFACLQGEHVVFLDVRKDRYFALEAAKTRGFGSFVHGWPDQSHAPAAPEEDAAAALAVLSEKGLICDYGGEPVCSPVPPVPPPADECVSSAFEERPRVSAPLFVRFLISALTASFLLRFRPFDVAVRRVQERNARHLPDEGVSNAAAMKQLIAQFAALRPYFFTAKDACLFEALALSEFLAKHGVFPRWVFGVQSRPFAAHCWLQVGSVVLNDTLDHVRRYAPIMAV